MVGLDGRLPIRIILVGVRDRFEPGACCRAVLNQEVGEPVGQHLDAAHVPGVTHPLPNAGDQAGLGVILEVVADIRRGVLDRDAVAG